MVTDIQTNYIWFSGLLPQQHSWEFGKISTILDRHLIRYGFLSGTRDIWCRDYLPIQVGENDFVQFRFDPSYLRPRKYKPFRTDPTEIPEIRGYNIRFSTIRLEGGNVVRMHDRVIISERVFTENPEWEHNHLIRQLEIELKAEVIIIPCHSKEFDLTGHADGMVRFYDPRTLLVNHLEFEDPEWSTRLQRAFQGKGFTLINIPYFDDPYPGPEQSAVGIYMNFLETDSLIMLPVFGSRHLQRAGRVNIPNRDRQVVRLFEELYPDRTIEPVQINGIGRLGGLVHCVSWNVRLNGLPHVPSGTTSLTRRPTGA